MKWMNDVEEKIAKIKKNKREWKKFDDAYQRGNWRDYVYNVKVDDEGNWSSTKEKLKGEDLKKLRSRHKKVDRFMKKQDK